MLHRFSAIAALLVVVLAGCGNESAGIPLILKDHRFTPAEIRDGARALLDDIGVEALHARLPHPF